jgi:RNA polymerase sigma-70 factor (ECF subfamily)
MAIVAQLFRNFIVLLVTFAPGYSSYNKKRMKKISFQNDILPLKNELYRLALRITLNPAEAEDVVQDTMIKVWNRREQWDEIESIEAFCLTICRNLSLDRMRKLENQNQSLEEGEHDSPDQSYASNPEEQAMQRDRVELIRRLINELPEKQLSAMHLREFEGKSYKEIASIMAISEEQVKVNIFRARQAIRQKYIESEKYGL